MRVRLSNLSFANGILEADVILASGPFVPPPDNPPGPPVEPTPPSALPAGYDRDQNVAFEMFKKAMSDHSLTALGVQGHGDQIVAALNETWPGLNVYRSPSDAPVWPGFGSVDVTIDSGHGGWSFRPDGVTPYEYDRAKR